MCVNGEEWKVDVMDPQSRTPHFFFDFISILEPRIGVVLNARCSTAVWCTEESMNNGLFEPRN